jgi:O-antigen ligase
MIVGLMAILLVGVKRGVRATVILILIGAYLLVPWRSAVQEEIISPTRTVGNLADSDSVRVRAAAVATDYALTKPFTGIGYGLFGSAALLDPRLGIFVNTHNDYLRIAAEAGIPAILIFLFLLGLAFRSTKSGPARALRPLIIVYAVGLLFANTLSNLLVTLPVWLALGVAIGLAPKRTLFKRQGIWSASRFGPSNS